MTTGIREQSSTQKILLMVTLLLIISLVLIGCGEVAGVEGIGSGSNSVMLSWTAPTTNEDGSTLDDLAGYKLYYGNAPGIYSQVITVGDFTTSEIGGLGFGTYYLTVTAYDIYGNESNFSNEINHTFL
jgi:hypothetical protein